jgi:hypothetical protein
VQRLTAGGAAEKPTPLTAEDSQLRFADGDLDAARNRCDKLLLLYLPKVVASLLKWRLDNFTVSAGARVRLVVVWQCCQPPWKHSSSV